MAILTKDMAAVGKQALKNDQGNGGSDSTFEATSVSNYTPEYMPEGLTSTDLCTSEADLEQTKAMLAAFRKVAEWTKKKFKMQETAADIALDLTKSKNAMIAGFAKTILSQAKSDADLEALLGAMPQMLQGLKGTVAEKKEKRVRDFTERLQNAGQSKATTSKTKK